MTDYLVLTDFVPGTKAKAQEVNANFSAVKDAINSKAAVAGDNTQAFSVASASEENHAVNKGQLDAVAEEFTDKINSTTAKFCVKSGNVTSGSADLFSYAALKITPKVGGSYAKLVISDHKGVFTEISSVSEISMSGKSDGVYNIFINADGVPYVLKNTIYRQKNRPTMLDGDIWLNTSVEPIRALRYNGTSDVEFLGVPLGKVTVASAAITAIETFAFNQNGYDVNYHSQGHRFPDYSKGVSKAWNTTIVAESDGILVIHGYVCSYVSVVVRVDGKDINIGYPDGGEGSIWSYQCLSLPICKGSSYVASGGGGSSYLTFYPVKGVN